MHLGADRDDLASRLDAQSARQLDRIGAVAMIGVEIVEPHGGLAHQHLTGAGLAERHFAPVDDLGAALRLDKGLGRSEEHTSELQSLMRISYAVFCLKKKK